MFLSKFSRLKSIVWGLLIVFALTACGPQVETVTKDTEREPPNTQPVPEIESTSPTTQERDLEIVTLLAQDAIQAIDNPIFLSAAEADQQYDPDELVLGVEFNGEARAYSIPLLSRHEIVNDTVGGEKIAVTW